MFASDGMRPDLMEKYAAEGVMPTYKALMEAGVTGANGMLQAFPPNTGVGWYTMATGAYPADHGSTNNTYFRAGDTSPTGRRSRPPASLQADTIANAAERAGKKVAQIDWVGGRGRHHRGPDRRLHQLLHEPRRPRRRGRPGRAGRFGVLRRQLPGRDARRRDGLDQRSRRRPGRAAEGDDCWTDPVDASPPQNPEPHATTSTSMTASPAAGSPTTTPSSARSARPARARRSISRSATSRRISSTGAERTHRRPRRPDRRPLREAHLAHPRRRASSSSTSPRSRGPSRRCGTAACNGLPAGGAGEDRLEKYIADNLPPWAAGDFAPLEAGVIDEDTYVEQGRDLERTYSLAVINYILGTLQPDTDLAMVGYPFTDEVSHQFMGLVSPTDADGDPNPCYDVNPKFDDVQCTGRGTAGRVADREGYIRSAYADADEKLGIARALMGGNPTTFAGSDHGFAPQ